MDAHEFNVWFGAINYLCMYPLMVLAPWVWAMIFFVDEDATFTDSNVQSIRAVFLLLLANVAPSYVVSLGKGYTDFYDVTVWQRMFPVALTVIITALIGQDPFDGKNMCIVMMLVDVGGGIAHGQVAPGGIGGVFERMWKLFKTTPKDAFHKSLLVESGVGMTFGFMACIYAGVVALDTKLGVMITLLSTFIVYYRVWFHSVCQNNTPQGPMMLHRLTMAGVLLYHSEYIGFGALNIVFRLMAAAMVLAIVSPYLGAIAAGASTLFLYKEATDFVFTVENGALLWLIAWGFITVVSSYGWLFLFYDDYDEKQKARVLRTHWQDIILGVFEIAAGGALAKAGHLAPGTVGEAVVYLLPPVTIWFTLETKMLNHMKVGTPFHPTWWVDGDLPKFSKTDYVNVTFGIATALITIILTSYAFYAVTAVIGFSAFFFDETSLWKFAAAHGITFVFHSGIWMIVASSGVPEVGAQKMFQLIPPPLPPFVRANPHDCVPMHKVDLVIGNVLLVLAAFCLNDGALKDAEEKAFKTVVFILWGLCTANKLRIHYNGWGYVDPVSAGKKKKA